MRRQNAFELGSFELDPELGDPETLETEWGGDTWESEVNRSTRDYIRWIQQSLNRILGLGLAVDGTIGPQTRSAIRSFQKQRGLTVGGVVGQHTEAALIAAGSGQPPGSSPQPPPPPPPGLTYAVVPGQEYGPNWGSRLPHGLPANARRASARGAALDRVRTAARRHSLGEVFVTVVSHLAQTESGATYGRPADKIFDARPPSERPAGKALITAWGVFQFNRDAWRALPGTSPTSFPWDASAAEEIDRPVARYAELFRQVRVAGGSDLAAARGVRLWHRSPAAYRSYVRSGERAGFDAAWRAVAERHRAAVDRRMQQVGLTSSRHDHEETAFSDEFWSPALDPEVGSVDQETTMIILSDSVGSGGANKQHDVFSIQNLLNRFILAGKLPGIDPLALDGKIGSRTIAAIRVFQKGIMGMMSPDGRVDPGGATLQRLNGPISQQPAQAPASVSRSAYPLPLNLVSTRMPQNGLGFTTSQNNYKFGVPETIEALKAIARAWHRRHPDVQLMVRDISRQGGGKFSTHSSHRIGLDADVQLWVGNQKMCMSHPNYSRWRPYVQDLVSVIRDNPILKIKTIGSTDRQVKNTSYWPGHTCHLHIRFCMPAKYEAQLNYDRVYQPGENRPSYRC